MPWTESRSREEWLAEARRRGERIRRRRRFMLAAVAVFGLVLPVSAVAGYLVGPPGRSVELSVAGPAPESGDRNMTTTIPGEAGAGGTALAAETSEGTLPPPSAPLPSTTTTEVRRPAAAVIEPVIEPTPRTVPATVPPADDPVIRSTTTMPGPTATVTANGGIPMSTPFSDTEPSERPLCGPSDLRLTVATDKSAYATGEPVKVTATVEKLNAKACRLPSQVHVPIDNSAGQNVISFPYTLEIAVPESAEPGMTFSGSYTWDQRDCVNASCAQVPPGTYVVYGSAPMSEQVSFQVGR